MNDGRRSDRAGEPPSTDIDWHLVLKRLVAFARQRLVLQIVLRPHEDLAITGLGDGPEQIATEVWEDAYCGRLSPKGGWTTTNAAVSFLIVRLNLRFLDRTRRQRNNQTVMVWKTETSLGKLTKPAATNSQRALTRSEWIEFRRWIIDAAATLADPLLDRYIALQYDEEEFMAFKRREAAEALGVSPSSITNVEKKVLRILKRKLETGR